MPHALRNTLFIAFALAALVASDVPDRLQDLTKCKELGFPSLTGYQAGIQIDDDIFLPVYMNSASNDSAITTVMIWTHGLAENAQDYFCDGMHYVSTLGDISKTLVIAPWFGNEPISAADWSPFLQDGAVSLWWNSTASQSWLGGTNGTATAFEGPVFHSSFSAMDALVAHFRLAAGPGNSLPSLRKIVISGFSAGCQFQSRWAFFSTESLPQDVTDNSLSVKVAVGDCGEYMYLDETRPAASCNSETNTGSTHTCAAFSKPEDDCNGKYNHYKYGLDLSSHTDQYAYPQRIVGNSSLLEGAFQDFTRKDLHFFLGTQDVCQCNVEGFQNDDRYCFYENLTCLPNDFGGPGCCDTYPDTDVANAMSASCEAQLGGSNRLQRGLNYVDHLRDFYLRRGVSFQPRPTFFKGGHDEHDFTEAVIAQVYLADQAASLFV